MSHYQELTSEKYWIESVEKEIQELENEKKQSADWSATQIIMAVVVFAATIFAWQQSANWVPALTEIFGHNGAASSSINAWTK